MILGLDHVQVVAPPGCEEAARAFYSGVLGLEEVAKPELLARRGGVWFRCGAQQLHVGVQEDFVAARLAHPGLVVASEAELQELASRLDRVEWNEEIPGVRRFFTWDPWGNRVEVLVSS